MTVDENGPAPLLAASHITKRFGGVVALQDASIEFHPGEVHCIAGENGCGKSTLMKVLSGAHRPTSGTVLVEGKPHDRLTPRQAYGYGIEVIYQDFSLMPNLTAAENIALPGYLSRRRPIVSHRRMRRVAEAAVDKLGLRLDLDTPVADLTVAERQLCAVARAMAHEARFIAMDEPTTALTWKEVDALFEAVNRLREDGVALAFISHKLQEVFAISDRVSVMRGGQVVDSRSPGEFTHTSLTEQMIGREVGTIERVAPAEDDRPPVLEVSGLTHEPLFKDISFQVRPGEIVGLAGLLGSGRTEIAEALAGVRPATAGTVSVEGDAVQVTSMPAAMRAGIAYVPEDRLTQGLFLEQPIGDNLVSSSLESLRGRTGLLDRKALRRAQTEAVRDLRIKIGSLEDPVRSLSGGNAQRVLLAKWLARDPKVLILNGPTVGVDVGSKFDILGILRLQALRGTGVLVISDDIPELVTTCHRVLVVRGGRLVDELTADRLDESTIMDVISA